MRKLKRDIKGIKELTKNLKKEIANLKLLIESLDEENLKKQMIPFIKEYHSKNIKSLMKIGLEDNYKLQKEILQLEREKTHLTHQIQWAEKNIIRDEKFVGVYIYRHLTKKE